MKMRVSSLLLGLTLFVAPLSHTQAGDWSQFLGSNRDGSITGFAEPDAWPKELSSQWKIDVGEGLSTPALVDGKLYVFSRQGSNEVVHCLDASSGEVIWKDDGYESPKIEGPAAYHVGPRSCPAVADGKVITFGLHGVVSCLDASSGKVLWRKKDFEGALPGFFASSSPIIVDGLAILQVGHLTAYDLNTGDKVWSWMDDESSYASSSLIDLDGTPAIVTPTQGKLVVLKASNGELLYEMAFSQGRNNTASPVVAGDTVFVAGPARGVTAYQIKKVGSNYDAEELWHNPENSIGNSNPVQSNGFVYGVSSRNALFAIDATSGDSAWSSQVGPEAAPRNPGGRMNRQQGAQGQQGAPGGERMRRPGGGGEQAQAGGAGGQRVRPREGQPAGGRGQGGPGARGPGGRGMGRTPSGFGSIVSAGSVLIALTPASELVVLEPSSEGAKELARYKVSDSQTYAYPVVNGSSVYIKDQNSLALFSLK